MEIKRLTPILIVESIEPALPFYEGRLGFTRLAAVPDGAGLGFVLFARGEEHLMLQTRASVAKDLPVVARAAVSSVLYVDVTSLDQALKDIQGAEILLAPRTTFYGAREVVVRDPAGQVVVFAEHDEG